MFIGKILLRGIRITFLVTIMIKLFLGSFQQQLILISGLLLCYLPWAFEKVFKVVIPIKAQLLTALFIFASQYLGTFAGFYGLFLWWDRMLHFVSGFLLAYWGIVVSLIFDKEGMLLKQQKIGLITLIAFLAASSSAAIWEMMEFLGDTFLGTFAQLGSLTDTMEDIICGTIGGGLFALYIGLKMKFQESSCVEKLFHSQQDAKKAK